ADFLSEQEFEDHKSTTVHRGKWLKHWYQSQRHLLASNKNGVEIRPQDGIASLSYEEKFGSVSVTLQPGGQKSFDLIVKNAGDSTPVILRQVEGLHGSRRIKLSDAYDVTKNPKFVRILP
ncbi:hypothetical protein SK128_001775, partial [Halocaridina rubra]